LVKGRAFSQAEVDFLVQQDGKIHPVEVEYDFNFEIPIA
jgi:hypothetical protein